MREADFSVGLVGGKRDVRQTLAWVWLVVNVISTDVTFDCVRQTVPRDWCETDSSVVLV